MSTDDSSRICYICKGITTGDAVDPIVNVTLLDSFETAHESCYEQMRDEWEDERRASDEYSSI